MFKSGDRVRIETLRRQPRTGVVVRQRVGNWEKTNNKEPHYLVEFDDGTTDTNVAQRQLLVEDAPWTEFEKIVRK